MVKMRVRVVLKKRELRQVMRNPVNQAMLKCGDMVVAEAKRLLSKPGGGAPSKSPAPPHMQTGTLKESIACAPIGTGRFYTDVVAGPTPAGWYGKYHEHEGEKEFGGKIFPPRQFMLPALRRVMHHFAAQFKRIKPGSTLQGKALDNKIKSELKSLMRGLH